MGKNAQVIEINGNQYDALTGQLIGSVKNLAKKATKPYHNLTIDGFVKSAAGRGRQPAQAVHKGAQRSRTLMRGLVKKPEPAPQSKQARPEVKHSEPQPNPERLSRAQSTPKDARVSRFGVVKGLTAAPAKVLDMTKSTSRSQPGKAPAHAQAAVRPMPSMVTSASHHQLERLLDHALTNASAHKQALLGTKSKSQNWFGAGRTPRWLAVGVTLTVALLIAAFVTWNNVPQVAVRVASIGSEVNASVPGYVPAGFSFEGPLAFTNSSVTMKFKSNADPSRNYAIVQKNSDWDSASLLANYLQPEAQTYQTSKVKGATVYIYGEQNNATWVDSGKWYTIQDSANLNTDQLLKIAESL